MRSFVALVLLVGCGGNDPSGQDAGEDRPGTLAYLEPGTQSVRVLDLATREDRLIDPGHFTAVSLALDGQHVSYQDSLDGMMKVADLAGNVASFESTDCIGMLGAGKWSAASVFSYCVREGSLVLSSFDTAPRLVDSIGVEFSPDASLDAYVDSHGNVIVESVDGSGSRILVPPDDPSQFPRQFDVVGFTPDGGSLILRDYNAANGRLRIVRVADAASMALPGLYEPRIHFVRPTILGASPFSSDGREWLLRSQEALVAVDLATGATRAFAPLGEVDVEASVFLDADHVAWVRAELGSTGMPTAIALHIASSNGADRMLVAGQYDGMSFGVFSDVIAIASDLQILRSDGQVVATPQLASTAVPAIIGLAKEPHRLIVLIDNVVSTLDADGTITPIVSVANTGFAASYVP